MSNFCFDCKTDWLEVFITEKGIIKTAIKEGILISLNWGKQTTNIEYIDINIREKIILKEKTSLKILEAFSFSKEASLIASILLPKSESPEKIKAKEVIKTYCPKTLTPKLLVRI